MRSVNVQLVCSLLIIPARMIRSVDVRTSLNVCTLTELIDDNNGAHDE